METQKEFKRIWLRFYSVLALWLGFIVSIAWFRTKLFLQESTYEFEYFSNSFLYPLWGIVGASILIWMAYTWFVFLQKPQHKNPIAFFFLLATFLGVYMTSPSIYTFVEDQKRKYIFSEADYDELHEQLFLSMPFLMIENTSYAYTERVYPSPYSNIKIKYNEAGLLLNMDSLPGFHYLHIKNYDYPKCGFKRSLEHLCLSDSKAYLQRIHHWMDHSPDSIRLTLENFKHLLEKWRVPNIYNAKYVWEYLNANNFQPRHALTTEDFNSNKWAERNDFNLWKDLDSSYQYRTSHFDDAISKQYIGFTHIGWLFNIHEETYYSLWLEAELVFLFLYIALLASIIATHVYNREEPKTYFALPYVIGFIILVSVLHYFVYSIISSEHTYSDGQFLMAPIIPIVFALLSSFYRKNEFWNGVTASLWFFLFPFIPLWIFVLIEELNPAIELSDATYYIMAMTPFLTFPFFLWLKEKVLNKFWN